MLPAAAAIWSKPTKESVLSASIGGLRPTASDAVVASSPWRAIRRARERSGCTTRGHLIDYRDFARVTNNRTALSAAQELGAGPMPTPHAVRRNCSLKATPAAWRHPLSATSELTRRTRMRFRHDRL